MGYGAYGLCGLTIMAFLTNFPRFADRSFTFGDTYQLSWKSYKATDPFHMTLKNLKFKDQQQDLLLFASRALTLDFDPLTWFGFRLHIAALTLTEPTITLVDKPSTVASSDTPKASKPPLESLMKAFHQVPQTIWLPFGLSWDQIGLTNLKVRYRAGPNEPVNQMIAKGLTWSSRGYFFGSQQTLKSRLRSTPTTQIEVWQADQRVYEFHLKIDQQVDFNQLQRLSWTQDISLDTWRGPHVDKIPTSPLRHTLDLKASLDPKQRQFTLTQLNLHIPKILTVQTQTHAKLDQQDTEPTLHIKGSFQFSLDLNGLAPYLEPFGYYIVGHMQSSVSLDNFKLTDSMSPIQSFNTLTGQLNLQIHNLNVAQGHQRKTAHPWLLVDHFSSHITKAGSHIQLYQQLNAEQINLQTIMPDLPMRIDQFSHKMQLGLQLTDNGLAPPRLVTTSRLSPSIKTTHWTPLPDLALNIGSQAVPINKPGALMIQILWGSLLNARYQISLDEKRRIALSGNTEMPHLASLWGLAQDGLRLPGLPKISTLDGDLKLKHELNIHQPNLNDIIAASITPEQVDLDFNQQVALHKFTVKLEQPQLALINYNLQADLSGNLQEQQLTIGQDFDRLSIKPGAEQQPITVKSAVSQWVSRHRTPNGPQDPLSATSELDFSQHLGSITLGESTPLGSLQLTLKAHTAGLSELTLDSLAVTAPGFGFKSQLSSETHLVDRTIDRARMKASIQLDASHLPKLNKALAIDGKVNSQIAVNYVREKNLRINSKLICDRFGFTLQHNRQPLMEIEQASGTLALDHTYTVKLIDEFLTKKDWNLDTFLNAAPSSGPLFQKVPINILQDHSLEALEYAKPPFHIKRVAWQGLAIHDLSFVLDWTEKQLLLQRVKAHTLNGYLSGTFLLEMAPLPNRIFTTWHFSNLNTYRLLEPFPQVLERAKGWGPGSDPLLSGDLKLTVDLERQDLEGFINMSRIGREPMRMMIYYLDPHEQDPSLSPIRQALTVADVDHVVIPIRNGFLDVDVRARLLAVPVPLPKISQFPIGQIIQNIKTEASDASEDADAI